MRRSLAVLAMAPVLMATTCFPSFDVRVSPGPAPMQAVFTGVRGKEAVELQRVTVSLCRPGVVNRVVWSVNFREEDGGDLPDSLVYGAPPPGFFAQSPPEPLAAGRCYQVSAAGRLRSTTLGAMGTGGFRVLADGTVADGIGAQGSRLAKQHEVDRAAVGCRRAYRRARTRPDSAGVDARVWAVSDTSITCGFLRTRYPETIASTESTEGRILRVAGAVAVLIAVYAIEDALHLGDR
jgi:hypothetical protein